MKKMNKVIAAMMMALTIAMPVAAANSPKHHGSTRGKVEVRGHPYRPDVKTCTIRVSRHESHKRIEAKAERLPGVMHTSWNPRTRELTVRYDAHVTSSHYIKHHIA
jgi:hypothetical protein